MKRIIKSILRRIYCRCISPIIGMYYRQITKYNTTGKIALCCIAKLENEYIRFFVEYYKSLQFDKIIICDNNDPEGERFEEVIGDYIQSGFVDIIDYRGKKTTIAASYQDCYDRFNHEYDWIAFLDCDEFMTFLDGTKDIHAFLNQKKFVPFQIMQFNWMVYGDNEMLDSDGRNVIERFKDPIIPYDFQTKYLNFPENCHIKSVLRGGLYDIVWNNPHNPDNEYYKCCNPSGTPITLSFKQNIDYNTSYLRHYSTKTIGEWVKYKVKRGDSVYSTGEISFEAFYRYNNITEEKKRYAEKLLKK